jgi:hypothetical protein
MIVNSPKRSTSESVGVYPGDGEARPHDESRGGREERAREDHRHRDGHAGRIGPRDGHEFGAAVAVLAPDRTPEPCLHDLERGVHEGEGLAAGIRGAGGEHRQQGEDAHLDEDEAAGPPVLTAMELQVQRSVDPGDPDQGEDDDELDQPADRDVLGEVVGRLGDDGHIDQVVEELEEADLAVGDCVAVWSRRSPEPALEAAVGLSGHGIRVDTFAAAP